MNHLKAYFARGDADRILELMALVETKTRKCFHEIDPELDKRCSAALDGDIHASGVIASLCKLVDSLNGMT